MSHRLIGPEEAAPSCRTHGSQRSFQWTYLKSSTLICIHRIFGRLTPPLISSVSARKSAWHYANLREFTRICASLGVSAQVYASLRKITQVCASLRKSARVYANLREFTRICASFHKFPICFYKFPKSFHKVSISLRESTQICASLRESARVYANLREFTRVCASF